ncbi:hypothetical protein TNIN_352211 [Trichonephila inaurata madagascariensis]|uniref:Uncharacterized protein n=1 Tax=Trichonephila inaurata madagascariensis TaxID=2747483 RepID=A0A8X6WNI0_9ARAC|nr:hypothetical protein TNIN_352211 [Trichonephila inaurata madagascariensis]
MKEERQTKANIREGCRQLSRRTKQIERGREGWKRTTDRFYPEVPDHQRFQERPLQSSRIRPGRSSPYNLRSRAEQTRKAGSRSSDRSVEAKEGPVRSKRDQSSRASHYNL